MQAPGERLSADDLGDLDRSFPSSPLPRPALTHRCKGLSWPASVFVLVPPFAKHAHAASRPASTHCNALTALYAQTSLPSRDRHPQAPRRLPRLPVGVYGIPGCPNPPSLRSRMLARSHGLYSEDDAIGCLSTPEPLREARVAAGRSNKRLGGMPDG